MSRGYLGYVRERLRAGCIVRYEVRGKRRYVYRREEKWYKLTETSSLYEARERRIGDFAFRKIIGLYDIEVVDAGEVEPAVVSWQTSGTAEALVATWAAEARQRVGASRDVVKEWLGLGARLEEDVAGEDGVELIRERSEMLVKSLD